MDWKPNSKHVMKTNMVYRVGIRTCNNTYINTSIVIGYEIFYDFVAAIHNSIRLHYIVVVKYWKYKTAW